MASPYKGTNMALKDIINGLFRRNQPAVMDTSVAEIPQEQGIYNLLAQKFQAETNRMRIVKVCREMYRVDARIEKSLRTLARDTLGSGFMVKVTEGTPSAQEEADKLQVRLGLNQKLEKYVRLSGRDGDSMLEIGVNEGMDISSLTRKPTLQIYRNTDITDRFIDPEKAFWMSNEIWAGTMGQEPPKDALWFAEWQIIHARWQHDEESRYGTPAFASSISAFKRVSEGETDVAIRRKVRAGMVMHHVVEGSASDIEKYKETNRAALEAVHKQNRQYHGDPGRCPFERDRRYQTPHCDDVHRRGSADGADCLRRRFEPGRAGREEGGICGDPEADTGMGDGGNDQTAAGEAMATERYPTGGIEIYDRMAQGFEPDGAGRAGDHECGSADAAAGRAGAGDPGGAGELPARRGCGDAAADREPGRYAEVCGYFERYKCLET
jgi:hypothetical protein